MWTLLLTFIVTQGVVALAYWIYKWKNPKCNGVLPPGSMGLPLIGETFQFFSANKSVDISPFLKTRINKYGQVFKTSLVGRPVVVSSDPELNHFILREEGNLVEMWYLDAFDNVLGQTGSAKHGLVPMNSTGYIHKFIRNSILSHIGIEKLKKSILPQIEHLSRETSRAWTSASGSIELRKATSMMALDLAANLLFGYEANKSKETQVISESLGPIMEGLMSFPINIPGTTYYKCMKNHKTLLRALKGLVEERLASPEKRRDDLLDLLIDGMKTESFLTESFIVYIMLAILIPTSEAMTSTLCLAIIYLSHHPQAVKEIEKEQARILQDRKDNGESTLSWKEYKSMTFTAHVVNESLRMANTAPSIMRRAIKDIHFNGYTIPKGWTIMIAGSAFHMNPETYEDPLSFNPWRWKDLSSSSVAKNFMPFGWGMRTCVGPEFATAMMVVFLHEFVSNYKWDTVKGGEIIKTPMLLTFGDGIHINVFKKQQGVDRDD